MLKIIDVFLSFAVIMISVSGLVMILTQLFNRILQVRGICLWWGLGQLIRHIEPSLGRFGSKSLVWGLLSNPVAGGSLSMLPGDYISKEDFITLLLEKGAKLYPEPNSPNENVPKPLQVALTQNGISNPKGTLSDIRKIASQIELRNPTLSIRDRQKIALAQATDIDFIAKINLWFEQTIDRISDTFTSWTRVITLFFSLALAAAINLNSVDLVHKLLIDDKTRDSLVQEAIKAQSSSNDELLGEGDLEVVPSLINKLQSDSSQTKPVSQFIWEKIDQATKTLLADPNLTASKQHLIFVRALNNILKGDSIYEPTRFDDVILRPETQSLITQNPTDNRLIRLNRLLMEDAYPKEINVNQSSSNDELFGEGDLEVVPSLINKLQSDSSQSQLVSQFIWGKIDQDTKKFLADPNLTASKQHLIFVRALNDVLKGDAIYEPTRFDGVILRPETQSLITQNPTDNRLIRLNRLLMEDAYQKEINVNQSSSNDELFGEGDLEVVPSLINKLQSDSSQSQLVSKFIWGKIDQDTKKLLADPNLTASKQHRIFVRALNDVLKGDAIYEPTRFNGVILRPETQSLISINPTGGGRILFNRQLLEDAYPKEIKVNQSSSNCALFGEGDFKVEPSLINKLQSDSSQSQLVSQFIWEQIDQDTKELLADPNLTASKQHRIFVRALNNILKGDAIYEPNRFDGVILRPETQSLITQNPTDNRLIRLNRLLMEDTYPMEIARNQFEYFAAKFRNQGIDELVKLGLIQDPKSWKWENVKTNLVNPGIILSGLLLSLGAPFWYDLLKSVLNFRGNLAVKDEKQEKK